MVRRLYLSFLDIFLHFLIFGILLWLLFCLLFLFIIIFFPPIQLRQLLFQPAMSVRFHYATQLALGELALPHAPKMGQRLAKTAELMLCTVVLGHTSSSAPHNKPQLRTPAAALRLIDEEEHGWWTLVGPIGKLVFEALFVVIDERGAGPRLRPPCTCPC